MKTQNWFSSIADVFTPQMETSYVLHTARVLANLGEYFFSTQH